jgi:hypothetical protein
MSGEQHLLVDNSLESHNVSSLQSDLYIMFFSKFVSDSKWMNHNVTLREMDKFALDSTERARGRERREK